MEALQITMTYKEIVGHGQDLDHGQRDLFGNDRYRFPSLRTFDKVWNT